MSCDYAVNVTRALFIRVHGSLPKKEEIIQNLSFRKESGNIKRKNFIPILYISYFNSLKSLLDPDHFVS